VAKIALGRVSSPVLTQKQLSEYHFSEQDALVHAQGNINIASGGVLSIDGVQTRIGDIVLLTRQTDKKENGLYKVQANSWSRLDGYSIGDGQAFDNKYISVNAGQTDEGKIFSVAMETYIIGETEISFFETAFSSASILGKIFIGDGKSSFVGGNDNGNHTSHVPYLIAADKRKLSIKAGTRISLDSGAGTLSVNKDTELDIASLLDTGSLTNGKDYYLFLIPGGDNVTIRVSLAKTAPLGLSPAEVKLIGGFHTLCADAGTGMTYVEGGETKDHPLSGYVAADILPHSVWCLNHRPHSEPEGMVYIPSLDFWCDIYLQSGSGKHTKSAYQGAITRSRQYVDFVEDMFCVRKELLDDGEFAAAMLGSNEQTTVAGASEAGATSGGAGGRVDTAGRRMISIYGVEEGCGSLWQMLRSTGGGGASGSFHGQTGYVNVSTSSPGPYAQAGGKGACYGISAIGKGGGSWQDTPSACGSRSRTALEGRPNENPRFGGRGRSRSIRFSE